MSDAPMTPLDEMRARMAEFVATNTGRTDHIGAFARLLQTVDPNAISEWFSSERRRGVRTSDAASAFTQVMACCLLAVAGTVGDPRRTYEILISGVHRDACRRISGEVPVEVVTSTPDGSRQYAETVEGLFADNGRGSDG